MQRNKIGRLKRTSLNKNKKWKKRHTKFKEKIYYKSKYIGKPETRYVEHIREKYERRFVNVNE